ncbi:MAG: EAL domain-containing protein [Gammaproteobacteria bacterium]|nr:EAL domain-containing protein [Gammaproteobacteria bacterium]
MNKAVSFIDPELIDRLINGNDEADNTTVIAEIEKFLQELTILIDELAEGINAQNNEAVNHALLRMKQSCLVVGAYELSAECERLELAFVDKFEAGTVEIFARIEHGYLKLMNLLNTINFASGEHTARPITTTAEPNHQAPAKILIIDDDLFYREMLSTILQNEGYQTIEVGSGIEGLETAGDWLPDLVLLDAVMDGMDGFEVCQHLKADQRLSKIPVIMVTALEDSDSIRRSFDAGATNFITKPVNALILSNQLRFILRAKLIEQQLRDSEGKLQVAQNLARLGHWRLNPQSGYFECSRHLVELCGGESDLICGSFANFLRLVHRDDRAPLLDAIGEALSGQRGESIRYRLYQQDGNEIVVEQFIEILHGGLHVDSIVGAVQDVTRQSSLEDKIWQQAYYDDLTGVATHRHLLEYMGKWIKIARRQGSQLALLYIELDGLKLLSQELREKHASNLLKTLVGRLQQTLRESDFIARIDQDQFCILASGIKNQESAAKIAENCLNVLNSPLALEDHDIAVMARIGIALYPDDGESKHQLLKAAIGASKAARSDSQQMFAFHDNEHIHQVTENLAYQQDLHEALQQQQFQLYYQPIVSARDGNKLVAVEVMPLWYHPGRGLVQDHESIPLLERTGKLNVLFEWMLDNVIDDLRQWSSQGTEIQVAIKLHPSQFDDDVLLQTIRERLDDADLPAESLAFEISSDAIRENETISSQLQQLRSLGVSLILSDFGSGHTSLAAIKNLPVDYLKIDQAFVSEILSQTENASLLWAIIGIGNAMGFSVIAEGVEDLHRVKTLEAYGCELFLGGFFSPPLSAVDVPALAVKDDLSESFASSIPVK